MKKVINILLTFSLILAFACSESGNNDQAKDSGDKENSAVLVFTLGNVRIQKGDVWKQGQIDMQLNTGDVIETGARSRCNLVIGKDSYISIKENSKLSLDKLLLKEDGTEETGIELKIGKSVINPKKLLKDDKFNVKTPTAIAAVRGTKFVVETAPEKKVKISVVEGKVAFKKRVPAIEKAQDENVADDVVKKVNEKLEEESVTIEANQSAEIDNKEAEELNQVVEEVIEEVKVADSAASKSEGVTSSDDKIVASAAEDILDNKLNEIDKKIKEDVAIEVKKNVETVNKSDVKELDDFVNQNKDEIDKTVKKVQIEKEIIKEEDTAENTEVQEVEQETEPVKVLNPMKILVRSPVKRSRIFINGKYLGFGAVEYNLPPNKTAKIVIKTRGYEDYISEIDWEENKSQEIKPSLQKIELLNRLEWSTNFKNEVKGQIVPFRNNMYIVPSASGNIYAINEKGDVIWTKKLSGGIDSTPVIKGNSLYVISNDGTLYSINAASGKELFKRKLEGTLLFSAKPLIVSNYIYVGTSAGYLYKISSDNGKVNWEKDVNAGIYSTLSYDGKYLYFGTDTKYFFAVDAEDGDVEWMKELGSRVVSSQAVINGQTVVVATYKGSVFALDKEEGDIKWTTDLKSSVVTNPVVKGKRALYGANDGTLYLLNLDSGKVYWKKRLSGSLTNVPSLKGNDLFAATSRYVYKINYFSGKVDWSYRVNSNIKTNVTVKDNNVYVGSVNGDVYSIRIDLRNIVE